MVDIIGVVSLSIDKYKHMNSKCEQKKKKKRRKQRNKKTK